MKLKMSDETEHEPSEYERRRNARIKRNEERLKELGLDKLFAFVKMPKRVSAKKPRAKKRMVEPGQERRSARLQRKPEADVNDAVDEGHSMLSYDIDEFIVDESKHVSRSRKLKLINIEISPEELKVLEKNIDDNYLDKFREFLQFVDKISEQNEKSVMRQVSKLASGEGVRYDSNKYGWAKGCYFMKGTPVTPMSDIVELLRLAHECENKW
eukprot:CAMPEP_0113627700 /NCGR_PEP_ID=MMETSP0017_2-20120614/14348_1 /TAXON_ID=2856 /ORGANISM="Cylindrotheca closterium" /LENGTH=211 /DNA_ID=CAMNT_0000537969 /DNA_START=1 /DNA_END=633 /DNA_ORIENTATION=+ /assembly_acc=CAM_ASM_000147